MSKVELEPEQIEVTASESDHFLMLHNDEVHTFDYVIDSLIEICNHELEQAIQCTMITHFNGKCDVKKGSFDYLRPMKQALISKNLKATID